MERKKGGEVSPLPPTTSEKSWNYKKREGEEA